MEHILSLSGGKDSTAMLLRILELHETGDNSYPLDEVVYVDTGMEFPEMYDHLGRLRDIVEKKGIKWTTLKAEKPFIYYLYKHEYTGRDNMMHHGYGWPSSKYRWCTNHLKLTLLDNYKKSKNKSVWYTGLAFDEGYRIVRKQNQHCIHPLADWGWTEAMCLQYCYIKGYYWGGLYEKFNRVSCWCCPLQPLNELKTLYCHYPKLWQQLIAMDAHCRNDFRIDYTLEQLQIRFELDKEIENESIKKKDYYNELYRRFDTAGCPKKYGFNMDVKKPKDSWQGKYNEYISKEVLT